MSNTKAVKLVKQQKDKGAPTPPSVTLLHLQAYPRLKAGINYLLSWTLVSYGMVLIVSFLRVTKEYLVDSPSAPTVFKDVYDTLLILLRKLDEAVNKLVLRDGVDAFYEQFGKHNNKVGPWIGLFALDFVANISNYAITLFIPKSLEPPSYENGINGLNGNGLTSADQSMDSSSTGGFASQTGSLKLSLMNNNNLPHVRELSDTTNALRKDLSQRYITPTKNMIESYLEPTRNKFESQYISSLNEKVESTKHLLNNKYDELVKPRYEAAYETVSKAYEGNLNSYDSIPRAIVSTGVDLGSKTFEKVKSATLHTQGSVSTAEITAVADEVLGGGNENEEGIAA